MVINKKSLLLARIKNCVENAPKSVTVQHGRQMRSIQGGKSVSIYLDALFGKIILRSTKSRQKTDVSFVRLCILIATQDKLPTQNVFLQGCRHLPTAKGIPIPCNNQKSLFCFQKRCRISWRLFTERHFLAENVMLNMSVIPKKQNLRITKHLQRLRSKYKKASIWSCLWRFITKNIIFNVSVIPKNTILMFTKRFSRSRSKYKITKSNYT